MAGESIPKTISGAGSIGRYFTVVSLVPSTVFVAYVVVLLRTGAWSSAEVQFTTAVDGLDLADLAVFSVAALLFALVVHPLGFALIQMYEGYWGTSRPFALLSTLLTRRHRLLATAIRNQQWAHELAVRDTKVDRDTLGTRDVRHLLLAGEAKRLHDSYPHLLRDVMPTRLGNVLRRYERLAGAMYALDAVVATPRVLQVAAVRDVDYVQNQRIQLELALRTSFLSLVASGVTVALMWRHGPWLLLALVLYLFSYIAYRGAVVVAHEYGTALAVAIELNRFALYERLRLSLPDDLEEERHQNVQLTAALRLDNDEMESRLHEKLHPVLDYIHPPPPSTVLLSPSPTAPTDPGWRPESGGASQSKPPTS